jgi:hypothetical protein
VNQYNPYEAPRGGADDAAVDSGSIDNAHAAILESLKKTRPWVLFLAILGYLGAGLMVLMGLIMMLSGSAMTTALAKGPMGAVAPFFAFIYIAFGGLYLIPSTLLWRYAEGISKYTRSGGSMKALANAIEKQTSFWRFIGIMTAALMVLYGVGIFLVMIFAMSRAVSH